MQKKVPISEEWCSQPMYNIQKADIWSKLKKNIKSIRWTLGHLNTTIHNFLKSFVSQKIAMQKMLFTNSFFSPPTTTPTLCSCLRWIIAHNPCFLPLHLRLRYTSNAPYSVHKVHKCSRGSANGKNEMVGNMQQSIWCRTTGIGTKIESATPCFR